MVKIFISIICGLLLTYKASAQNNDELALQSLEYLNHQFHLNLDKENDIILIKVGNSEEYICHKYSEKEDYPDLTPIKWRYEVRTISTNKYEFTLKSSSEFKGTFEAVLNDKDYVFTDLEYIKRND